MRSSSSALFHGEVSMGGGEVSVWTPEALSESPPARPTQKSADEAVAEALEHAELAAEQREAELIAQLESEKERAVEAAYQRGFDEGREKGEHGEAARLRTAVQAAEDALEELRAGEVRWTGTIEENICALSTVIARQVLGRELAMDIKPVGELVKSALAEFPVDQPIRIRINPSDLSALSSVGAVDSDPLKGIVADRDARWHPDVSIAPGGCMVEGRERIIDGRIDTALERVYRRLTYTNA
jgi:flagellar assembly protein FliH